MSRQGQLWRLSVIDDALAVLDEPPADAEPPCRAVVNSNEGKVIRLILHRTDGAAAMVELPPARVVALSGDLIEAATPRLA